MKKTIVKEVQICDFCQKEAYIGTCLRCGVEHCWECRTKLGVEYHHSTHASGSGDGYYCIACDMILKQVGTDPLHQAYLAIADLRAETERFYADWRKRDEKAENNLKKLQSSLK